MLKIDVVGKNTRPVGLLFYYEADTGSFIELPFLEPGDTIVSWEGTAQIEIQDNRIVVTQPGSLWDITFSNGSFYPCCESGGNICFDVTMYRRHGYLNNVTFKEALQGEGSNYLNEHGYTTHYDVNHIALSWDGNADVRFDLRDPRDFYFFDGKLYISGTTQVLTGTGSADFGTLTVANNLICSGPVRFNIEDLQSLSIVDSVIAPDTEVYGDISNLQNLRLQNSLDLANTTIHGDVSGLQNCNFRDYLNLANTSVEGDIHGIGIHAFLKSLNLENTSIYGDVAQLEDFRALRDVNLASTGLYGNVSLAIRSSITEDVILRDSYVHIDLDQVPQWNPSGIVDCRNINVSGNLANISDWPTDKYVDFSFSTLTTCTISSQLFPNCRDLRFEACPLTRDSVDAILISKNYEGTFNGNLNLKDTKTPNPMGFVAYNDLLKKGWTIELPLDGDFFFSWVTTDDSPASLTWLFDVPTYNYNGEFVNGSPQFVTYPATDTVDVYLFFIENLKTFDASNNFLEGGFPRINGAYNLEALILRGNHLSGQIPRFVNLDSLTHFDAMDNEFTGYEGGIFPKSLTYIDLSNNHLSSQAVTDIMVGLDYAGSENGHLNLLGPDMGVPSQAGFEAGERLKAKGWEIYYQGQFQDPVCDWHVVYDFWILQDETVMGC